MNGEWQTCYKCQTPMWVPQPLNDAALRAKGKIEFFCAYGHGQYYIEGQSEEQKLRLERDRLKQQIARVEDEAREARNRAEKAERATRLLKRRAAAGTCPCCQRTFSNMTTHMRKQHPEYVVENIIPLKAKA